MTVTQLIKMLKKIPGYYDVKYDLGGCLAVLTEEDWEYDEVRFELVLCNESEMGRQKR